METPMDAMEQNIELLKEMMEKLVKCDDGCYQALFEQERNEEDIASGGKWHEVKGSLLHTLPQGRTTSRKQNAENREWKKAAIRAFYR